MKIQFAVALDTSNGNEKLCLGPKKSHEAQTENKAVKTNETANRSAEKCDEIIDLLFTLITCELVDEFNSRAISYRIFHASLLFSTS